MSLFQLLEKLVPERGLCASFKKPLSGFKKWVTLKAWLFLSENLFFGLHLPAFPSPMVILNANESHFGNLFG